MDVVLKYLEIYRMSTGANFIGPRLPRLTAERLTNLGPISANAEKKNEKIPCGAVSIVMGAPQ